MAASKKKKTSLTVKAKSKNGFYRCGLFFPHEGVEVELTSEQLERIKVEPNLIIEP
ncbi:HI1506-related protein [uncultured Endozoicomonas sp.]|uniref:HI1506-related protein n=1 Tax=uncultured Endozoicomonas sp. TaxID=432652 RepID=UPI002619EACA|nr:HI1506-related protein [uncultured Endozoicomonas sp.]